MSSVSNVIVAFGLCGMETDADLLAEINSHCDSGRLVFLGDYGKDGLPFANRKVFEANIAAGAFNGLNVRAWIDRVRENVSFKSHECNFCQFIVQDQENDGFGIYEVYRYEHAEDAWEYDMDRQRRARVPTEEG